MLTIKDLSANQELDRTAMGAVAGGSFSLDNDASDLFDILGAASQVDYTAIANVGNHGSLIFNYVDNDKDIDV